VFNSQRELSFFLFSIVKCLFCWVYDYLLQLFN